MKNKMLITAIAALVVAGSTVAAVSASKSGTRPDDSIHQDDKITANMSQQNYKVEDHSMISGQTKETDHITSEQAADIAVKTVNGTVTKIQKELEHGRWQYKVELSTKSGEAKVRIDAETGTVVRIDTDDDSKSDDGSKNRHSGDDDNKAGDGEHRNRHTGDDDNKVDDGEHRDRHSGDDDADKYDDNSRDDD